MNIIGVTKCPSGLAHTYIAAKQLEKLCQKSDNTCKVETQGASGIENELTQDDIDAADYVFIIADVPIANEERFQTKKIIKVPIKAFLNNGKTMLETPEDYCTKPKEENIKAPIEKQDIQKHLMSGLNYLIPVLVISGTLFGFSFHLKDILPAHLLNTFGIIYTLCQLVALPLLSGFIANSISGKIAMVPAMLATLLFAQTGNATLCALLIGLISGYIVLAVSNLPLMKELTHPVFLLILPVVLTCVLCFVIQYLPILQTFNTKIIELLMLFIKSPYGALIGCVIGFFVTYDFGGRLNKIAYMVGVLSIPLGVPEIMSAVAVAICIPPLSLTLYMFVKRTMTKDVFKQNFILGLFGVTEGVIPHVEEEPLLKQAMMVGTIIASGVALALQLQVWVPHGGVINAVFLSVNDIFLYLFTIFIGILVTNIGIWVLKNKKKEVK